METPTNQPDLRFANCGEIIRELRQNSGISLRGLAERLECSPGQLSKLERNSLTLSFTMAVLIAQQLEIPPSRIVVACLRKRFPRLGATEAGKLVSQFLDQ